MYALGGIRIRDPRVRSA